MAGEISRDEVIVAFCIFVVIGALLLLVTLPPKYAQTSALFGSPLISADGQAAEEGGSSSENTAVATAQIVYKNE